MYFVSVVTGSQTERATSKKLTAKESKKQAASRHLGKNENHVIRSPTTLLIIQRDAFKKLPC